MRLLLISLLAMVLTFSGVMQVSFGDTDYTIITNVGKAPRLNIGAAIDDRNANRIAALLASHSQREANFPSHIPIALGDELAETPSASDLRIYLLHGAFLI